MTQTIGRRHPQITTRCPGNHLILRWYYPMPIWRVYKVLRLALSAFGWGMISYLAPVCGSVAGQNLFY